MLYFYFVDRPGHLFVFEFEVLLFYIRESMMMIADLLLAFVVIMIHFPSESVE